MGRNFVFECVSFFCVFSTQNLIPQITVGVGRVIYHIKALSVICTCEFSQMHDLSAWFLYAYLYSRISVNACLILNLEKSGPSFCMQSLCGCLNFCSDCLKMVRNFVFE